MSSGDLRNSINIKKAPESFQKSQKKKEKFFNILPNNKKSANNVRKFCPQILKFSQFSKNL